MLMETAAAAIERIEFSRARLRLAMTPQQSPPAVETRGPSAWLDGFESLPGVRVVIDAVSGWWAHHPLRAVALVAGEASSAAARPLAQRSPWVLVAAAAVVGAALARSHPWRWLIKPALFAGLVPQLAARFVSHLPVESWVSMLSQLLSRHPTAPPSAAPATARTE